MVACTFYPNQYVRQSGIIKTICKHYLNHPVNSGVLGLWNVFKDFIYLIYSFSCFPGPISVALAHLGILCCFNFEFGDALLVLELTHLPKVAGMESSISCH